MNMMKKCKLFFVMVFFAILIVAFLPQQRVNALTSTTGAVKAGQGEELWNADEGGFNDDVLSDLVDKLFGDEDPVAYIKTMKDTQTDSYVIPASTINAKVGSANDGLVVKLDGKEWMATSLTLAEIDGEENVVLTLYLANDLGTSQYYTNSSNVKGNNMYSRSTIRNHLLTNTTWSLFQDNGEDSFAQQFLVQPKYVKYQQTESHVGRANAPFNYNCPNDALGALSSGWYGSINYQPADTFDGKRYDDWGNDYIWLPSATETGYQNYLQTSSIWKLTANQLSHNGNSYSWLRSGAYGDYNYAYLLQTSGAYNTYYVYLTYGVRPALHFNLSSAALGAVGATLRNPENVSTTYNGDVQTLKSAYEANKKGVSWYNQKWYEHTENYVKVTSSAELKNAGEYWVSVELQQKWFDDMDALVEAQGAEQGWSADEIAAAKLRKKPKFKGDPDTSDSEHIESDRIRWFKFTIKPKEIAVTKPAYNSSTGVFTAPSFVDESELHADPPVVATRFTGTAADGTEIDQIDVVPNRRGNYTAQTIFVKSSTDKTEYIGNYVVKDAENMTCTVQINRSRLAIVGVANNSKVYTGAEIEFALTGYSTAWTDIATLTLPNGMTLKGSDDSGWKLVVTEAGSYVVIASIKSNKKTDWCWNTTNFSEEIVTDRTFTITITRKTLNVEFTSTASGGGFLLQAGSNVEFGTNPTNALARDDVKLTLEYYNASNPNMRIPVAGGTLDASILNPGTYYLVATLNDTEATGNKNYKLEGGEAKQEFTVSAKNIVIDSVNWQYSQNNGAPISIASGAGDVSSSPFEVIYNGSAYVFIINTNGLADLGVKVDVKYGTNGYTNGSQTNAIASAIAITVRLIPFDNSFAFNDSNGKPLEQQYKDFTIYIKVNKADVDFSNVVWSADQLEYNAVNQSVSIISGLPSFLSATYNSGATGRNIGTYTAKVTGLTVVNQTIAANYNIPSSSQIASETSLTHTWNIVKKRIEVTWITTEKTQDGNVIFVPSITDNSMGAIEYTYYNADKTREMTLDEIFADYDATTVKDYYVCARLKASGGSYNATNCVLIEASIEVTESYQGFQAGSSKTPVRVGLKTNSVTYNKTAQPAEIEVEGGGLLASNVTITYKQNGIVCGVPTNAGEYKVIISLNNGLEGEFAITGQCEFDYIIEKANYDVSAMKWVDTENDNAEYTEPYTYAYGVTHTLAFIGDDIDGLSVNYTSDTEANLSGGNARDYKIVVTFSVRDSLNYNVPDDIEFTWTINPYTPDLSNVTWNYNTNGPYTFSIVDGVPVNYSVFLQGLPEGLENLIEYSGDTAEYSDAGSHVTNFLIKENDPNRSNYGELVFSGGLETRLVWEIKPLLVDKPILKQTKTFCAEGYSFSEITNLPEDWAQYFEVQVLDSEKNEILPTDGTWTFIKVDRYQIKIMFKQGMNGSHGGTMDNVKWSDNGRIDCSVVLNVEKLVLAVNGWIDDAEGYAKPTLNADNIAEIEKYFNYVLTNKETNANVGLNEQLEYETSYTIALQLKSEFSGNVAVKYLGHEVEETTPYGFLTGVDPLADDPENFYRKPTEKELYIEYKYTGKEITFKLGEWFIESKMQILSGVLAGTDEGIYQVRIGFKKGANSAWGSIDDFERTPVTVNFVISADAKIADRFVLKDGIVPPFKFQYGDFTEEEKIEEYVYSVEKPLFITRLARGDSFDLLLAQFENGADIKVFDANGNPITDLSTLLATGMILRLVDGDTILNQLTISVLGDVNGDGKVNVTDKTQLNAHIKGNSHFEGARLLACDVTGDGKINVTDKSQLNAQLKGDRDIYGNLSLKSSSSAFRVEPVKVVAQSESEIFSYIKESIIVEFTKEVEMAISYTLEDNEMVQSAGLESVKALQFFDEPFKMLVDKKRYAICNRRKEIL